MKCIKTEDDGHEVDGVGVEDGGVRSVQVCVAQCGDSASSFTAVKSKPSNPYQVNPQH